MWQEFGRTLPLPHLRDAFVLLISAFAVFASFFAISIGCDYRYLCVSELPALIALVHLSPDAKSIRGGSR